MIAFRVWLRPLGDTCRVQVEGSNNSKWLLDQLGRLAIFKTSQPVDDDQEYSCFRVAYGPLLSRTRLERMLVAIPQVRLMNEPA